MFWIAPEDANATSGNGTCRPSGLLSGTGRVRFASKIAKGRPEWVAAIIPSPSCLLSGTEGRGVESFRSAIVRAGTRQSAEMPCERIGARIEVAEKNLRKASIRNNSTNNCNNAFVFSELEKERHKTERYHGPRDQQ